MDPNSLFLHFPKKKTCLCVSRRQSRFLPSMFIDPFGGNVYFTVPPYKRTKIQAPCGEFRVITQRTKRRRGKQRRKIHDTTFTIIERNINTPIAKKTRINDLQGRCRIVSIADSVSFNHGLPLLHRRNSLERLITDCLVPGLIKLIFMKGHPARNHPKRLSGYITGK